MIRPATVNDLPEIVRMGSRSLMDGPYKEKIKDDPQTAAELVVQVIEDQKGKVFVAEENGKLIGILGLVIFPNYYTREMTAHELIWYVLPEYRRSFTAAALFRRAEAEARNAGCVKMVFTAPTQEVAKAYEALGYKALEVAYYKDLN